MKLKDVSLNITESEYRDIDRMSYSLLSTVDRLGYKCISEEFVPNIATTFGTITESILFEDYNPDEYYVIDSEIAVTDTLKKVIDVLFPILLKKVPYSDNLEDYHDDIIEFCKNDIGYYDKWNEESKGLKLISETKEYWKHLVKSRGKLVITNEFLHKAKQCANTLRNHDFTSSIFSVNSFFNIETISQFKVMFSYNGFKFKAMLDWLVINHDEKVIKPYDLKTGGKQVEDFAESFYYWRYDIQAYLYSLAIKSVANKYYPDYKIEPFRFVYISRNDVYRPLVYSITEKHLKGTENGFYRDGQYFKSISELISELNWYKLHANTVYYTKEVYDNKGELLIDSNIKVYERKSEYKNKQE